MSLNGWQSDLRVHMTKYFKNKVNLSKVAMFTYLSFAFVSGNVAVCRDFPA